MPTISAAPDEEPSSEDTTLLTLYALAGEESGGFATFRPQFFHSIGKAFFKSGSSSKKEGLSEEISVRELNPAEMIRAEKELWVHYRGQRVNLATDRLFAAFSGTKIIGVARCIRHNDCLEVDAVYFLEEFRRRGFARSVMTLLLEECGRSETLYMRSRIDLVDFYGEMGFFPVQESSLPQSIRDKFESRRRDPGTIDTCPMKRDPPLSTRPGEHRS